MVSMPASSAITSVAAIGVSWMLAVPDAVFALQSKDRSSAMCVMLGVVCADAIQARMRLAKVTTVLIMMSIV